MSTLFKRDVKVTHVITSSVERSRALEDETRTAILTILAHKILSTDQLVKELKKLGFNKAITTVRHHLDVLKDSGLVEIVRVQEVRGAVKKYYASTVKYLGSERPLNDIKYDKAVTDTSARLLKVAVGLVNRYKGIFKDADVKQCRYCELVHEREYIIVEIMNRALAEMIQRSEFSELMKK